MNHRGWGTSVVRGRILVAGALLLAAGCLLLASPHSRQLAANTSAPGSPALTQATPLAGEAVASDAQSRARAIFASLPLTFEPNQGQANLDPADPRAKFTARGSGYSLYLGSDGAILRLSSRDSSNSSYVEAVAMKLAGANPNANLTAFDRLPGQSNYFLGNDPTKWRTGIPQFSRVRYEQIYPGIDLVFYGSQGHLEYDFQVAPGSDPSQAELEFSGAKRVELREGALILTGQRGSVRLDPPRVYQKIAGREQPVSGGFVLRGTNRAGFAIGNYDHSRELVIDPILSYSTYFGGISDEGNTHVAVDSVGNIYIAGSTQSNNLPTLNNIYQPTLNGTQNVYIAKLNATLGAAGLIYVTYLGGEKVDYPAGLAVDGAGDPFVVGTTTSTKFPTSATAYQNGPEPGSTGPHHVFVTGLNNLNGFATQLGYSSYLSGNGDDVATGMTIDARGYVYVTGNTTSTDAPTASDQFPASTLPQAVAYQNIPRSSFGQFFVTKVNTNAPKTGSIAFSTYFGGGNFVATTTQPNPIVQGGGIAIDNNSNIYFSGTTNFTYTGCQGCQTTDFPILNAYQPCLDQPPPATVINPQTCSNTTTTSNSDAFVAKFNNPNTPQGVQLLWSTYVGGAQSDSSTGIALDSPGATNVYVVGTTNSHPFFAVTSLVAAFQECLNNLPPTPPSGVATCSNQSDPAPTDAYVARLSNPATNTTTNMTLTYFSYLGGADNEVGNAITVDSAAGAIITGSTRSPNNGGGAGSFPVVPPNSEIQSQLVGTQNAFVARLNTGAVTGQNQTASWSTYLGGSGIDEGTGVTLDVNQNVYVSGDTNSPAPTFPVTKAYQSQLGGGYDSFVTELGTAAGLEITGVLTLGTDQTYISAGNPATFTYTLTNTGPDLATNITVTDTLPTTGVIMGLFSPPSATSGTCSGAGNSTNISCNIPSLQSGSTATITIVLTPTPNSGGGSATFNGGTVTASSTNSLIPVSTSVSGTMSDFTITANPPSFSVANAGATAQYNVQLAPNPVYGNSIALSCSGLPPGAACSFTTTPVTLVGTSPGGTVLNITTTARPVNTPASLWTPRRFYAVWLSMPALALIGVGLGRDRRRRRIAITFLLCALFAMLLLQPACSSTPTTPPVTGTPAGTWPITITATSGSDTKNAFVKLIVP